jgi:hypothetical protein
MNCNEEDIDLPFPTNAIREGPIVEFRGASLTVKYDHEDDRGRVSWAQLNFEEVLAYRVFQTVCSASEDLVPSGKVRVTSESSFRSEVAGRWNAAVGTQEYQRRLGGVGRFKQYQIYFDDVCSIRIIAASFKIGISSVQKEK